MNTNPLEVKPIEYENDLEDFQLPYKLQNRTDNEMMQRKYQGLNKVSYGYIVRLGIIQKGSRL